MKLGHYKIDIWILIPALVLIFFSLALVYSASSDYALQKWNDSSYLFKQHLVRVAIALVVLFVIAKFDYRYLQDISKLGIIIAVLLLIYVLITSSSIKNVNRWINLGFLSFQPSDFAKFALIIHLSNLLVRKEGYLDKLYKGYLPLIGYIILICGLVAAQPNFSTSLIIFSVSLSMILLSGVKVKHVVVTIISIIPFAALFVLSKSYIISRIESYAEYSSTGTAKHQLTQAIIGLGNGGFFGVGPGNSVQKEFFLPESYGDFIFSIVGEEYGFIGTLLIISMFVLILYRGLIVSKKIEDPFGKYLSFGITIILVTYAVVNMSVATGIFPTTGVPIPFVSFGGTAIFLNSAAIGILLNISSQINKQVNSEDEGGPL